MKYLLTAIDAFKRRLILISPKFEIPAAKGDPMGFDPSQALGRLRHQLFYDRPELSYKGEGPIPINLRDLYHRPAYHAEKLGRKP